MTAGMAGCHVTKLETWSHDADHAHFRDCPKSILFRVFRGSCSKFGEGRSKTELAMLAVVAGWTDTGRTDGHRTDAKVTLYSVQCCTLDCQLTFDRWLVVPATCLNFTGQLQA